MKARLILLAAVLVACRQRAGTSDSAGATAATMGAPASLPVDTTHDAAAPAAPGAAPADSTRVARTTKAGRSTTGAQVTAQDTLRGTPAVVGTDRFNQVVLKPAGGGKSIVLAGSQVHLIRNASGADVWVSGTRRADGQFEVSRFEVRAADGAPAFDGTLEQQGSQFYLVTADGRRHVVNNVPAALRSHVGERVWLTGTLEKGPVTFGVLGK